jgi:hypothetical protein
MWSRVFLLSAVLVVAWTGITAEETKESEKKDGWCEARQKDLVYDNDNYWDMPNANRKCKPGHGLISGNCAPCPVGTYNFEDARVDECFKCPVNKYGNETGMTECHDCESWDEGRKGAYIALQHGSTSSKQCVRPEPKVGNFVRATVGFKVKVQGADFCSNIKTALWGASRVIPFDGHFYECNHSPQQGESHEFTNMAFEVTLPRNLAWDFWTIMDMVNTHRDVGNAYVKMGRHFVDKLAGMINGHSDMEKIGLNIQTKMLNIDNIKIMEFSPYFKGHCQTAGDNSPFCDAEMTDASKTTAPATVQRYYVHYTTPSTVDCNDNAVYTSVRNAIERSGERKLACLKRETERCEMELVFCDGGHVVAAVVNTFRNSANAFSEDKFTADESNFVQDNIPFKFNKAFKACPKATLQIKDDHTVECADSCDKGKFINNVGMCQLCPFGTYGEDGIHCKACNWDSRTPWWGMNSSAACMKVENEHELADGDWSNYLRDLKGENDMKLEITPEMNMCGTANAVKAVKAECKKAFAAATDLVWNDALDFEKLNIQRIVCMGANNIKKGFSEVCEAKWDKSWDKIFKQLEDDSEDGDNWKDVFCYVFKKVQDLDEADTSDDCKNLDKSKFMMSMPAKLNFTLNAETSEILVPIMNGLKNLETMKFASFAVAEAAMLKTMGIEDMKEFTGWKIANQLRDLSFAVTNGFRFAQFDFEGKYNKSDFLCANGQPKRDCGSYCNKYNCRTMDADKSKNLQCHNDECNNCATHWWFYDAESKTKKDFKCAACEFPKSTENATLVKVNDNNVEAQYKCNDKMVPRDCSSNARCDYGASPMKVTLPQCVEDKCAWKQVANAKVSGDWRGNKYHNGCPYQEHRCDDGYMNVHNRNRITCRPNNNYKIEGEVECIKACSFPEQIPNGKRVETGRENHHVGEYWAKYECDDGYVLREGERGRWARCSTEEKNGTKTAVAKLPQCKPVDTCKFPDSIGKACKWEEKTTDEGKKHAYYRCPEGMDLHGTSQLRCKANETSQVDMRDIKCVERKKCAFPDKIEFGYKVQNKTYDHNALYRCDDGYHIQGSVWASCNKTTGKDIRLPKCVKGSGSEDDCHLPESIEGGKRAEKHHNRARYECHGEWRLPDSLKKTEGWVMCNGKEHQPDKPHCVKGEPGQCEFPKVIFAGYKMREGEHDGHKYAVYQCIPPYVMTPNKDSFWGYMKAENKTANQAYMQMAYTAGCHEGKAYLPSCVDPRRAMHCGLPNYIEGGKAVGFMSLEEWMKEHGKGKDHKDDNNKDKEEEKEKEKEKEEEKEKEKEKEEVKLEEYLKQ